MREPYADLDLTSLLIGLTAGGTAGLVMGAALLHVADAPSGYSQAALLAAAITFILGVGFTLLATPIPKEVSGDA